MPDAVAPQMDCDAVPGVSVIIPTYQRPAYLKQALGSVYNQTYQDFEVIVVDDGSGDEYTNQYELGPNTKLICHDVPKQGCAAARNTGMAASRGRYLAFLDDDDVWLPGKLEAQVRAFREAPGLGLSYCHYTLVDADLHPCTEHHHPKPVRGSHFRRLLHGNFIKSPSVVMISREVIETCGYFNDKTCGAEDWELWVRAAHRFGVQGDIEPLVLYRVHGSQMTGKMATCRRADAEAVESLIAWAQTEASEALPALKATLACRLQKLAKWEARLNGTRAGLRVLGEAIRTNPTDIRHYTRALEIVAVGIASVGRCENNGL